MNRDARRAAVLAGMDSPPDLNPDNPVVAVAARWRRRIDSLTRLMRTVAKSIGQIGKSLAQWYRRFAEHLRRAGLSPVSPPDDPRGRALWLRQHRSTGPPPVPLGLRWPAINPTVRFGSATA